MFPRLCRSWIPSARVEGRLGVLLSWPVCTYSCVMCACRGWSGSKLANDESPSLQFCSPENVEIQSSKPQDKTPESRLSFAEAMVIKGRARGIMTPTGPMKGKGFRVPSTWRGGHYLLECEWK